jgi:hypothetical protein
MSFYRGLPLAHEIDMPSAEDGYGNACPTNGSAWYSDRVQRTQEAHLLREQARK